MTEVPTSAETFSTISMDLAASLTVQGLVCVLETYDGFEVEFMFPEGQRARDLAARWGRDELPAESSRRLTVASRQIRAATRKVREQYARDRVPVRREFRA